MEPTEIIYFYVDTPDENLTTVLHREHCFKISNPLLRKYVGLFASKSEAMDRLKHMYPTLKTCKHCLKDEPFQL